MANLTGEQELSNAIKVEPCAIDEGYLNFGLPLD